MKRKETNEDLLKGAIADAKKIRETALANAKQALEEAFTPQLQSMFSKKVQEEMEDEEEDIVDVPVDDTAVDDVPVDDSFEDEEEIEEDDDFEAEDEEDDFEAEDEELEEPVEEPAEEDDLDLDEIIAELEAEDDEFEGEELDEEEELDFDVEDEDEVDLQELYNELMEDDTPPLENMPGEVSADPGSDYKSKEKEMEVLKLRKELNKAYNVIQELRSNINEVHLLNAKLLFANKLFKKYNLNESSKKQVIETLDRAQSSREAKLIFVTLAEAMNQKPGKSSTKAKTLTEGLASKTTASTKPKKIVNEVADRWQKLANIK